MVLKLPCHMGLSGKYKRTIKTSLKYCNWVKILPRPVAEGVPGQRGSEVIALDLDHEESASQHHWAEGDEAPRVA